MGRRGSSGLPTLELLGKVIPIYIAGATIHALLNIFSAFLRYYGWVTQSENLPRAVEGFEAMVIATVEAQIPTYVVFLLEPWSAVATVLINIMFGVFAYFAVFAFSGARGNAVGGGIR
jgi:hypothetical protein